MEIKIKKGWEHETVDVKEYINTAYMINDYFRLVVAEDYVSFIDADEIIQIKKKDAQILAYVLLAILKV